MVAAALILVVLPVLASREVLDTFDLPKQSVGTVLAAIALGAWLCRQLEGRSMGHLSATPAGIAATMFLVASVLSLARCINVTLGAWELGRMVVFVGTMAAICDVVYTPRRAKILIACALVAGIAVTGIGLTQVFGSEYALYPQVARPASSFGNKNMASEYLVTVFSIPLAVLFFGPAWIWLDLLATTIGALMAAFLIAGWTRTDYVAAISQILFIVGLALVHRGPDIARSRCNRHVAMLDDRLGARGVLRIAWSRGKWLVLMLVAAAVLAQAPRIAPDRFPNALRPDIGQTLQATFHPYSGSVWWRITAWANTCKMVLERPLLGWGINNWQLEYPLYHRAWGEAWVDPSFDTRTQATTLHNDYLQVWAESGLAAFLGLVILVVLVIGCSWDLARIQSGWRVPGIAASLGCMGFSVDALGSFPLKLTCPALQFFILGGIALAAHHHSRRLELERLHAHGGPVPGGRGHPPASPPPPLRLDQPFHPSDASDTTAPTGRARPTFTWRHLLVHPRVPGRSFAILSLFAGLIGLLGISSRAIDDLRSNSAMREAFVLQSRNHWCPAVLKYVEAIRLQSFVYSQYLLMGRALFNCGLLPLAEEANAMAAVYHPNHCNVYFNWGNCLRELGRMPEALEKFTTCVALYPDNADGLNSLGIVQRDLGKLADAADSFHRASIARPDFVDAQLNEGLVLTSLSRIGEAQKIYEAVLKKNPANARAWVRLGDLAGQQGKLDEAQARYDKALQLQPAYLEALNNLAGIWWKRGNAIKAQELFHRALSIDPNFGAPYFGLADIEYRLRVIDRARANIHRASAIDLYQQFLAHWFQNDTYMAISKAHLAEMAKEK